MTDDVDTDDWLEELVASANTSMMGLVSDERRSTQLFHRCGKLTVIEGRSMSRYHAGPELSAGRLKDLARSPAHYRAAQSKDNDSKALKLGRAFHALMESQSVFARQFAEEPKEKINRRSNAGKAEWSAYCASINGRTILTREEIATVYAMAESVMSHQELANLLNHDGAIREASLYWNEGGIDCRCRPDWWIPGRLVIDYKTAEDASAEGFAKAIRNFDYDLAAAHYFVGAETPEYGWLVVEKTPPYAVALYLTTPDQEEIREMTAKRQALMATLRQCQLEDDWPGYAGHGSVIRSLQWKTPWR